MTDIAAIEGIGEAQSVKLKGIGIATTEALLERGKTPKGRDEIAQATGISGTLVLRWVNHADLFRIKGVAGENSELLEAAGVDTVAELARRNSANLHQALSDANTAKKLVRQLPTANQVSAWIEEAKTLPRAVEY
jgi:predicted RecB family nuclease